MALPVPEDLLIQVAIQMLCGFYGEMVGPDQSGQLKWRPLHVPGVFGPGALAQALQPLADFGSLLQEIRNTTALLEAVAPPFAPAALLEALDQGLKDGMVCGLTGLSRFWDFWNAGLLSDTSEATDPVNVFGLCWQSMGLMLTEFLSRFSEELQRFEASAPDPDRPRTLMRLLQLIRPWSEAAGVVRDMFDSILLALRQRKVGEQLPSLAAEELLSSLSRCACSQNLSRVFHGPAEELPTLLSELWCGAARPLLSAAERFASLGEQSETFEFSGKALELTRLQQMLKADALKELPALLPPAVAGAGRSVGALRAWSQAREIFQCILARRCSLHAS